MFPTTTAPASSVSRPEDHAGQLGRPPGLDDGPIYLDYNATTPVDTRVTAALLPYLTRHFGNPSSGHQFGREPRAGLEQARQQIGQLINVPPEALTFTGSGSESDALAIRGVVGAAAAAGRRRPHVITQATEHPAVLAACQSAAQSHQARISVLPVDCYGLVDPEQLRRTVTEDTVLVTIMHANNETGTIQPLRDLAQIAHEAGALFHTDAAQTAGKIPLDAEALGIDLLTLVGHKMYAPKGVAALYIRSGVDVCPLIGGGGQERGRRAGTENVPYAIALGAAATYAGADLAAGHHVQLVALRDQLHAELKRALAGRIHLNGHPERRLPHTLNVSIDGARGHELLAATPDLAASTGSACHSGDHEPSPVLTAMGLSLDRGLSALRLSLGRWTTLDDVHDATARIIRGLSRL
jgi:cysteine desulfurase